MKPRTLARIALKKIKDGTFTFDKDERKREAIRQLKMIISGKQAEDTNPKDPIIELNIGVYIPSFDYPIIPLDTNGEPIVWKEDKNYFISDSYSSHIIRGISITGETYFLSFLDTLSPYRDCIVKADRYTDTVRAAWALTCTVSKILNKWELTKKMGMIPLKIESETIIDDWNKHSEIKEFDHEQKKLYIKWLTKWIQIHGKNPNTHMRVLKLD